MSKTSSQSMDDACTAVGQLVLAAPRGGCPRMVWLPSIASPSGFFCNIAHIISIYTIGNTVYVERARTTSEIGYRCAMQAEQAMKLFARAMESEPTADELAAYPKPVNRDIRVHDR